MIYLFSRFHCVIGEEEILPFVFYEMSNIKKETKIVYGFNGEIPFVINFYGLLHMAEVNKNVEKVNLNSDTFLFLNRPINILPHFTQFKVDNKEFCVSVSNNLLITIAGEKVLTKEINEEITYSHYEKLGDYVIIYFEGLRKFVIIIQKNEIKFAEFYDEINVEKDTRIFMCKLYDSLNHGKVAKIKDNKFESFLVYLDDNELNMKTDFMFLVFLDCLIAKNYKYCNNLLCKELKQKDEKLISKFFNVFDEYIPFKNVVFTFEKNTLAGVYEFKSVNNEIENIIHLL